MIKKFLQQNILDKHKGRPAFVLGAGPSLRYLDPETIKSFIIVAANNSIQKFHNADYFLTCDPVCVLFESWYMLRHLSCEIMLFDIEKDEGGYFGRTQGLAIGRDIYEGIDNDRIRFFQYNKQDLTMNKNSCKLIQGSSSIHSAVNLAYLMGCDPIILSGCDCQYVEGKHHYSDFEGEKKCKYIKHPYTDTLVDYAIRIPKEGDTDRILGGHAWCWERFRNQNPHINIIDTSGGRLTMFPRMTIKEAINKYGV